MLRLWKTLLIALCVALTIAEAYPPNAHIVALMLTSGTTTTVPVGQNMVLEVPTGTLSVRIVIGTTDGSNPANPATFFQYHPYTNADSAQSPLSWTGAGGKDQTLNSPPAGRWSIVWKGGTASPWTITPTVTSCSPFTVGSGSAGCPDLELVSLEIDNEISFGAATSKQVYATVGQLSNDETLVDTTLYADSFTVSLSLPSGVTAGNQVVYARFLNYASSTDKDATSTTLTASTASMTVSYPRQGLWFFEISSPSSKSVMMKITATAPTTATEAVGVNEGGSTSEDTPYARFYHFDVEENYARLQFELDLVELSNWSDSYYFYVRYGNLVLTPGDNAPTTWDSRNHSIYTDNRWGLIMIDQPLTGRYFVTIYYPGYEQFILTASQLDSSGQVVEQVSTLSGSTADGAAGLSSLPTLVFWFGLGVITLLVSSSIA